MKWTDDGANCSQAALPSLSSELTRPSLAFYRYLIRVNVLTFDIVALNRISAVTSKAASEASVKDRRGNFHAASKYFYLHNLLGSTILRFLFMRANEC
jgi:hypothetical protein